MKSLIFIVILLTTLRSSADSLWQEAQSKPQSQLPISKVKSITSFSEQISCKHLRFRYGELANILKDISWLANLRPSQASEKLNAHAYIQNRLQADPSIIASGFAYQIQFSLPHEVLKEEQGPVEAIGILGATNFDLLFPEDSQNQTLLLEKKEKEFILTTKISAYDICAKGYIDIFIFKLCPRNITEEFDCGEFQCPPSLTYDWQSCGEVQVHRVNLKSFENKLGLRNREIKWSTK